jgi:hypothetical protein
MRIKTFSNSSLEDLETEINQFLSDHSDKIEYRDLKYSIAHEAVATDSETGVYSHMEHTAILIFKVDSSKSSFFV